ncbi:hypothetical protein [Melittangium boletus]|uniref:hypothetical protein n=1 Tax=Melittangium boletus TaxID=83453 RepID=UPI0012FE5974|nr:hypothetical protein [Melittangium boletus]
MEKMLDVLAAQVARGRAGEEVPTFTLTLHLAQGIRLSGMLLDYLPREAILLASTKEGLLSRGDSVTYVEFSSVIAVSVDSPALLNQVPFLVRATLGRDDLLQYSETLSKGLTEQFWPGEAQLGGKPLRFEVDWVELDTEPGRRALEDAMNAVAHALRLIGREPNGRDSLRRIARVRFSRGRTMAAFLDGDTGQVSIDPAAPVPSVQALRKGLTAG